MKCLTLDVYKVFSNNTQSTLMGLLKALFSNQMGCVLHTETRELVALYDKSRIHYMSRSQEILDEPTNILRNH